MAVGKALWSGRYQRFQLPHCPRVPTPSFLDLRLLRLLEPRMHEWLVLRLHANPLGWDCSPALHPSDEHLHDVRFERRAVFSLAPPVEKNCGCAPSAPRRGIHDLKREQHQGCQRRANANDEMCRIIPKCCSLISRIWIAANLGLGTFTDGSS